jgi:hypothetical protein
VLFNFVQPQRAGQTSTSDFVGQALRRLADDLDVSDHRIDGAFICDERFIRQP